ncbi:MAG: 16S rRNA (adenine(1518)-N(6)/adenine(1519)-N(6))-dimethyltransferase RsmA [Patescibacteria group bacterium]|jgi:16S rRNA (adenine1518-N6/adenine1519-N6)-dimethyltransferase
MDLTRETKKFCKINNIKPARSKGQNFLIKEKFYNKIIQGADLNKDDIVLEVGPGPGFLTERLAEKVKKVIAVELDDRLAIILRNRLKEQEITNIEIVNENILKSESQKSTKSIKSYKVVANLPYNITSRFLRKFLEEIENKPEMMVLMVQKEVAERIIAKPPKMSLLAVACQFYADVKIIANVPNEAFWPKPKVDSAILKLQVTSNKYQKINEQRFFILVRAGFSAKRKQLQGNLSKGLKIKPEEIKEILIKHGLKETIRAQELSVDDWKKIFLVMDGRNML